MINNASEMLGKLMSLVGNFYGGTKMYREIIKKCWLTLIEIITDAKFIFFSMVAISIGTIGIWVPVIFGLDLNSKEGVPYQAPQIENFPIFMYIVGVLGTIAAEYLTKNEKLKTEIDQAVQSFSMFIWFLALVLSFWALKYPKDNSLQLWLSLWLAISLWMSFTHTKDDFKFTESNREQLEANGEDHKKFAGDGL